MKDDGASVGEKHCNDNTGLSASCGRASAEQVVATCMMPTGNYRVKLENYARACTIANSTRVDQAAQAVHAVRTPNWKKRSLQTARAKSLADADVSTLLTQESLALLVPNQQPCRVDVLLRIANAE
jgi:hypothetical protein